jgi:hypothetical protein
MLPVGFEPKIPASEGPQTYALDRAATGTGKISIIADEYQRNTSVHLRRNEQRNA